MLKGGVLPSAKFKLETNSIKLIGRRFHNRFSLVSSKWSREMTWPLRFSSKVKPSAPIRRIIQSTDARAQRNRGSWGPKKSHLTHHLTPTQPLRCNNDSHNFSQHSRRYRITRATPPVISPAVELRHQLTPLIRC